LVGGIRNPRNPAVRKDLGADRIDQDHLKEFFFAVLSDPVRVEHLEVRVVLLRSLLSDGLNAFGQGHAEDSLVLRATTGDNGSLALPAAPDSNADKDESILRPPANRSGTV
jgi:hypothetical protein